MQAHEWCNVTGAYKGCYYLRCLCSRPHLARSGRRAGAERREGLGYLCGSPHRILFF